jgi:CheY-like chemotaxis protein
VIEEGAGKDVETTFEGRDVFKTEPAVQPSGSTPSKPDFAELHPCKILIVEDNETNRRVLTTLLSRMGYRPTCVNDGQAAVDLVEKKPFDLILMDVRMPVMDGLSATRLIRKRLPRDKQPKIVALTAHVVKGEKEKCLLSGMNDFIPKPITPETLMSTIRSYAVSTNEPCQKRTI